MKPRSTTWFPLALMIGLAMMSLWLEYAVRGGEQGTRSEMRQDPDFYIENFTTTDISAQGRPRATLSAKRMVHYPHNETSHLEEPHLIHMTPDRPPVHITAERGLVTGTGEEVELFDNVVVRRLATAQNPELKVETSYLQVFPDDRLARTPKEVLITEGASRLKGVGMEVNSSTGQLKLQSKVTGFYVKSGASGQ